MASFMLVATAVTAQEVKPQPTMDFTSSIIQSLVAQGPLGILCLVLMFTSYRLWVVLERTQEKRIEEARESIKAMQEYTKSLTTLAEHYRSANEDTAPGRRRK